MPGSLRYIAAAVLTAATLAVSAQKDAEFDPTTASIEENIKYPAVSEKNARAVVARMDELKSALKNEGYDVTSVRSGQVVMVTIPCSDIFSPNETILAKKAASKLAGLKRFIRRTADFKVVLAVHSDDTGDETYADRLTADRANAIDDYFYREDGHRETGIIPYGIGADEPLADNHGRANRARNRRIEIYFIPTQEFIKNARK